jgi:hypothetical protein
MSDFVPRTVQMLRSCVDNRWIYVKYSLICQLRRKCIAVIGIDELVCVLAFDKNLFVLELR